MTVDDFSEVYDYLIQRMSYDFERDKGESHKKIEPRFRAKLIDSFERAIYSGDGVRHYFLMRKPSNELMIYNGRYYESYDSSIDILSQLIKRVMRGLGIATMYEKLIYKEIARQCIEGMGVSRSSRYTPSKRYIVFSNCVFDTKSGDIRPFSMSYQTDLILDFSFIAGARSVLWERVLSQTIPDVDSRESFQKFCGAFLIDRSEMSIEYMCYLIGDGRNGKSVITGAIAKMFGDSLISNFSPQELFSDSDKKFNRASLVGKIANFSDDVKTSDFSGGMFKQFVSGHKINARKPFEGNFELSDLPYLVCCVNQRPTTTDESFGHFRRLLPILCPNKVAAENVDTRLGYKLSQPEVKAAIFNWINEGRRKLIEAGGKISLPIAIHEEVERQKIYANSVKHWIYDSGFEVVPYPAVDDDGWLSFGELYKTYRRWCRSMNEPIQTDVKLSRELVSLGFRKRKRDSVTEYCIGIKDFEDIKNNPEGRGGLPF
jgi:putative DNA primase/helicase